MLREAGVALFVIVLLFAGWRFEWSSLDFSFVELSPPAPRVGNINYVPRIVFYDQSGNPVETSSGLVGGNLNYFSKILLLLSLQSKLEDPIKVKFVSSQARAIYADESRQIHESDLGQEFVLYPDREITADVMNLNPTFLKEMSGLNLGKKIDFVITTLIEFPGVNVSNELQITCKNNSNSVNQNYKNTDLTVYYPSCLITGERKI
jgi:hypothetical protein